MTEATLPAVSTRTDRTLQALLRKAQARGEMSVARVRLVVLAVTLVEEVVSLARVPGLAARVAGWVPLAVILVGVGLTFTHLRRLRRADDAGPVPISVGLDAALVVGVVLPGVLQPIPGYTGAFAYPAFVFFLVAIAASALRLSRPLVRLSIACNVVGALLVLVIDAGRQTVPSLDAWLVWTAAFVGVSFVADAVAVRTRRVVYEGAAAVLRAEHIRHTLGAYVSDEVAEIALASEALAPGGRRQAVAVLMVDLRGFSAYAATIPPERLIAELNAWLGAMVAVVQAEGGLVDKYLGDAVMVVFGVPKSVPDAASRALRTAARMERALAVHNEERAAQGLPPLHQGIGVHYGEVVVGNVGTPERMQYTVVGDVVNMAARLEQMTKELDASIVASAAVVEVAGAVEGLPPLRARGLLPVRGHPVGLSVYTLDRA